ncbi:hypothetical protein EOK98_28620 [Klebsiella pneumoniae]|nr:hypothetical protein EOK98_28620 [Klebsiella pneumoniae]
MEKNGESKQNIAAAIKTVIEQINRFKHAISSRNIEAIPTEFLSHDSLNMIRDFFNSYSADYQFLKGSIYYDSKSNPVKHIKAY